MADRLLRFTVCADRLPDRIQLQRFTPRDRLEPAFRRRWYSAALHDQALLDAALLSLRVAAVSASIAAVVGTLAGYARPGLPASVAASLPGRDRAPWCSPR